MAVVKELNPRRGRRKHQLWQTMSWLQRAKHDRIMSIEGDLYKVKTFREITKLERNGSVRI